MRSQAQTTAHAAEENGTFGTDRATASLAEPVAIESHPAWPVISQLPACLAISLPLQQLHVRDLLELQPGMIFRTVWSCNEDVPLHVGTLHIARGEFDVLNGHIALRITALA